MPAFLTTHNLANSMVAPSGTSAEPADTRVSSTSQKVEKTSRDFESILLNSWAQGAYATFGSVPGADNDDSDDSGQQYKGMAIQSLSTAMVGVGGLGIAKLVSQQLEKNMDSHQPPAAEEKKGGRE